MYTFNILYVLDVCGVQEELDQMSEFLVLKSTEEQREEGVDEPVDTAFIEDRDGMPILKASFDVHHFKPDEVCPLLFLRRSTAIPME